MKTTRASVCVGTLPDFRRRGIATLLMSLICREVTAEGEIVCLFYENPAAGAIYRRMGFEEVGEYMMLTR